MIAPLTWAGARDRRTSSWKIDSSARKKKICWRSRRSDDIGIACGESLPREDHVQIADDPDGARTKLLLVYYGHAFSSIVFPAT